MKTEYYLIRLLIIFGVLVCGFFISQIIANLYYEKMVAKYSQPLQDFRELFQEKINGETDPYNLVKLGKALLKSENYDLAYKALKKSTDIDPKWRDSWIVRGDAELKMNQPKDALTSLKEAEKVDPIYPLTYQLLALAYQATGDKQSAQFAQEKAEFLSK